MATTCPCQDEQAIGAKQTYQGDEEECIIGTKAQVFLSCCAEAEDGKEDREAESRNHEDNNNAAMVVVTDAVNRGNYRRHLLGRGKGGTERASTELGRV